MAYLAIGGVAGVNRLGNCLFRIMFVSSRLYSLLLV
ncbi:uncharacterized protein METZ01_LOCUS340438 [marine metagenome]|uniref:Uncharacterized protein n=1 Tax=marine metagenome TaxID=408172 RepID=A0A382QQ00_9ZZZZ